MKTQVTFIDAKERNRQNPGTYPRPGNEQLEKLWKGDSVKIGVESFRDGGIEKPVVGDERFLVKVTEMRGQELEGLITTGPLFTEQHGLKHLDTVTFERCHIMEAHIYDCPQCKHRDQMGYDIPEAELTPAIAELLCPNCRAELPFEKLGCPISQKQLAALCEYVEEKLEGHAADGTLRFAAEFCEQAYLPKEETLGWLRDHGGYCDLEVIANVARRWVDDLS